MNKYESVIIIKPELSKTKMKDIVEEVERKIKEYATITEKQELGKKKLAYEVKGNKEAYYIVYQFTLKENITEDAIRDIERFFRITDEILKYIIVDI